MSNLKALVIITENYPFGNAETFIESEIPYVSGFDKVFFYSTHSNSESHSPRNVGCAEIKKAVYPESIGSLTYIKSFFRPRAIAEAVRIFPRKKYFKCLFAIMRFEADVNQIKPSTQKLIDELAAFDEVVLYSYWMYTEAMIAIDMKKRLDKLGTKTRFITRAHRFEIFNENNPLSYCQYQKLLIRNAEKVYVCSDSGRDYLRNKYPEFREKIITSYLGTEDSWNGDYPSREGMYTVISCSNVIEIKRVRLIAEALSKITDTQINWIHFGDGYLIDDLKAECRKNMPSNIRYEFRGRVSNKQVLELYESGECNLFLNVSSNEGIPVSIMEAASFGIPVVATDVGGTSEIVENGRNGYLLNSDFDVSELADYITSFKSMSEEEYNRFCVESRKIYENKFNASHNYPSFYDNISNTEALWR